MLWVDKHRPKSLESLDVHPELTTRLAAMVSPSAYIAADCRVSTGGTLCIAAEGMEGVHAMLGSMVYVCIGARCSSGANSKLCAPTCVLPFQTSHAAAAAQAAAVECQRCVPYVALLPLCCVQHA